MSSRIDTVEARKKLAPRRAPYWARLSPGLSLGYRRMTQGSAGTWLARQYDEATQKETWRSLGGFEELPAHERYGAAKKAAEELAAHMGRGGSADTMTVSEACAAYIQHQRREGKGRSIDEAELWVKRWIDKDPIGRVDVRKLTAHHLRTWRQKLATTDVIINPHAEKDLQRTRKRTSSTVNRQITTLRAALNHALEGGIATTDAAWRTALRPTVNADRRRNGYLDKQQRAALIDQADGELKLFIKGLCLVPLRPGALAALTAGDFDRRLSTLRINTDKAGEGRSITLPPTTAAFFLDCCKDKLPNAHIFSRDGGKPWDKDAWKKPIKAAAAVAGLPAGTTAYILRHSVITDLITGGLDPLTVARLSGTSIAMIEKYYGHLRADHAASALATLAV